MALTRAGLVNDLYFVRMHSLPVRETVTGTCKLSWTELTFVWFIAGMLIDVKLQIHFGLVSEERFKLI